MFSGDNGDSAASGSEFLLQILNNPPKKEINSSSGDYPSLGLTDDPAVAAVGPSTTVVPQVSSNGGYFTPSVHSRHHSVLPTFPTLLPHPVIVPLCVPQGCPPEHRFPRDDDGGIEAGLSKLVLRDDSVHPNSTKLVFGSFQSGIRDSFYRDPFSGEGERCSVSRSEECRYGGKPGRFQGCCSESEKKDEQFECGNRVADEVAGSSGCQFDLGRILIGVDETAGKNTTMKFNDSNIKDAGREKLLFGSSIRNCQNHFGYLSNMERLNSLFYKIYLSLIPTREEKEKQGKLLKYLGKVISKDFPKAWLHLYGSCANSFDVSRSDIDVCLEMKEDNCSVKSNILLKLAAILQVDNLQNVKALTRARVPVVKFFDPKTGISCDVCLNNMLAVVNTKLLSDYARIDPRLRQLVFIVKYWAKCRGVNETYKGTLSSYAYVLMCIHLLQRRRPAILPCLQRMKPTFSVWVNDVKCEYFDRVEELNGFGSGNRESIAELVTEFFNYWAHYHDYANSVISVRTGTILTKWYKKWTRRVGNDRHLICIEDPLEVTHDLGRVVDKFTITPLRQEFIRAADILNNHPYPLALFQPLHP